MAIPCNLSLYEINTRVWLGELGRKTGRQATFDDIPEQTLDDLASLGFDWVWFLGVWQTGEAGRAISRGHPEWRREYQEILPDLKEEDITGSPFAIQNYTVHTDFGGDESLRRLRSRLHKRGLRLLLDFVPNHTALDHPWVHERPEFYIRGTDADLAREPRNYCRVNIGQAPRVLAHGRDPYFPGWPDTLQLNYRHPGLRDAMKEELVRIASLGDGVRCDMAMLMLPDVFVRTWGAASLPAGNIRPVDTSFWVEAIAHVRTQAPEFLFMAEAYWDLEWTLQQEGFDYTYDKRLYDRLQARDAGAVWGHLRADQDFQRKSVRFLENHDEPRAAAAFPAKVEQAAATVAYLLLGLRFFHEGQLEGRKVKLSVHLGRRPDESVDSALSTYYLDLLKVLRRPEVQAGRWQVLECRPAWEGNPTWERFLAFYWEGPEQQQLLIAVNYGPTQGQCYVRLPFLGASSGPVVLRDLMSPARYERDGKELVAGGLYLDMTDWGYHVFELTPVSPGRPLNGVVDTAPRSRSGEGTPH